MEAAISQAAKARCTELEAQCEAKCKDIEAAVEARVIAEAQAEGYLKGLEVDTAMSIINQMVSCYLQPYLIAVVDDRLSEEKLGLIVGAIFDGLDSRDGGARGTQDIRAA